MTKVDLSVNFAGLQMKNPVTTASGTFAARESGEFYDISRLGAVITKGVAAEPWQGNPTPRIAETYGGMLNAVGLQNPGAEEYTSASRDDRTNSWSIGIEGTSRGDAPVASRIFFAS